jgi:hypothetical protein
LVAECKKKVGDKTDIPPWPGTEEARPSSQSNSSLDQSFLKTYTPSALLQKGEWQIKLFSNLYTQTAFFNDDRERTALDERSTYYTNSFEFLWGLNNTVNIGVDLFFQGVKIGDTDDSPLQMFNFQEDTLTRRAFTHAGPRIKLSPFPLKAEGFSIQSSLMIPIVKDLDNSEGNGRPFLDYDSHVWLTQLFYDLPINDWFQLFFESDVYLYVQRDFSSGDGTFVENPYSAFANFYPTDRWTVYTNAQFTPTYGGEPFSSYFVQTGIGMKYQIIEGFEAEILYTNFVHGFNAGAGQTFNVGVRVVR